MNPWDKPCGKTDETPVKTDVWSSKGYRYRSHQQIHISVLQCCILHKKQTAEHVEWEHHKGDRKRRKTGKAKKLFHQSQEKEQSIKRWMMNNRFWIHKSQVLKDFKNVFWVSTGIPGKNSFKKNDWGATARLQWVINYRWTYNDRSMFPNIYSTEHPIGNILYQNNDCVIK